MVLDAPENEVRESVRVGQFVAVFTRERVEQRDWRSLGVTIFLTTVTS